MEPITEYFNSGKKVIAKHSFVQKKAKSNINKSSRLFKNKLKLFYPNR